MAITDQDLQKIAELAYLHCELGSTHHFAADLTSIMNFAEVLRQVDTTEVSPLFHPYDLKQPFRGDEAKAENLSEELAKQAPSFEEDYYLVPKIIDSGQ